MIYENHKILDKIYQLTQIPGSQQFQKEKYHLLNCMLQELCQSSNSKQKFIDLSNYIMLFLHLYKGNYKETLFLPYESAINFNIFKAEVIKQILKKEFEII